MKIARLFLGLALLATTLMATECPFPLDAFLVNLTDVVLFNDSNQPIHILSEGESFAPGNQLQPNTGRVLTERLIDSQAIMYRAGRNGAVLATVQCTPRDQPASPEVIWTGGALVCAGWTGD